MNFFTVQGSFCIGAAVMLGYFFHSSILVVLETAFHGSLRTEPGWRKFLAGFCFRIFTYFSIPILLAVCLMIIRLLPDSHVQQRLKQGGIDASRSSPYSAADLPGLDFQRVGIEFGATLAIGIILCVTVRIMAALYGVDVVWFITCILLVLLQFSVFAFLYSRQFYTLMYDAVLRPQFPDALPWLLLTGGLAGFLTEFALDRFPLALRD